MKKFTKLWKNSASLILLVKNKSKKISEFNYDLLTFKRAEQTAAVPNTVVFPGGGTDKFDESKKWILLYKALGVSEEKLNSLKISYESRPFIFQKDNSDDLEREISLRITAIRETFEELGILVCKTKDQFCHETLYANFVTNFDALKWQHRVHNDASQFLNLCEELNVAPDLWSSYEWSNWLTPSLSLQKRRYETAFYTVALETCPPVHPEPTEVKSYSFTDPRTMLKFYQAKDLWLAPPQLYEIRRFMKYKKIDELIHFAKNRSTKGSKLFMPVLYQTKDKLIYVLPGDDMYPADPNYNNSPVIDFSEKYAENLRENCKNLHRFEAATIHDIKYYINIKPFNEHIIPTTEMNLLS